MTSGMSRENAIKLGLGVIDSNLDQFSNPDNANKKWQMDFLQASLTAGEPTLYRRRNDSKLVTLTGETLRDWLMDLLKSHKRKDVDKYNQKTGKIFIFEFGSDMLTFEYLEKIGYVRPETAPQTSEPVLAKRAPVKPLKLWNPGARSATQPEDYASPAYSPLTEDDPLAAGHAATAQSNSRGPGGPQGPKQMADPTKSGAISPNGRALPITGESRVIQTAILEPSHTLEAPPNAASLVSADESGPTSQAEELQAPEHRNGGIIQEAAEGQAVHDGQDTTSAIVPGSAPCQGPGASATRKRHAQSAIEAPAAKRQRSNDEAHDKDTTLAVESAVPGLQQHHRQGGQAKVSAPSTQNAVHSRSATGMPKPIPEDPTLHCPLIDLKQVWPSPKYQFANVVSPGSEWLEAELSRMRTNILNLSSAYLKHSDAGCNAYPEIVQKPSGHLEELYMILFGRNAAGSWLAGAEPVLWDVHRRKQLLAAVIGAAIYEMVFMKDVPWNSPIDLIKPIQEGGMAPYLKAASAKARTPNFDLESNLYNAAQLQVSDPQFQNATIRPIAKRLAVSLAHTMRPQLQVMGVALPRDGTWEAVNNGMSAELTYVLTRALIVRGQMQASLYEYEYVWYPSGSPCDDEKIGVDPPLSDGEQGEVAFCIMPGILFQEQPTREWHVASRAIAYRKVDTGS